MTGSPHPRKLLWIIPLTVMVRPIATIQQAGHVRLWQAWLIHLVGLGLCAITSTLARELWANGILLFKPSDLWPTLRMPSTEDVVMLIAEGLAIEAAFILAAWALMAWSAWPGEKATASFARSLGRIWLLTSLGASVIGATTLLTALFTIFYEQNAYNDFYILFPFGWERWGIPLFTALGAMLTAIVLWAMAAGRADQQMCRWPGQCEGCGYPLVGLNMTHSCPECGQAVADSLGPSIRPGCAADRRPLRGWLRTSFQALCQPRRLGRSLRVMTLTPHHSYALAINLALLWLVGPTTILTFALVSYWMFPNNWSRLFEDLFEAVMVGGGFLSLYWLVPGVIGIFVTSSLVGSLVSRLAGRNLLPLATQATSYASIWLSLWALVMTATTGVGLLAASYFRSTPTWFVNLSIVLSLALPVIGLAIWLGLVWRITWAGRYANR